MKSKATFYHAGCPVCISAEQNVAYALDPNHYELDIVHLGECKEKITEAKSQGVQSVPALVIDNQPFHINFGAALTDLV
ncbi:MAG: thioredoxin family protein [Pseudanabaena sp.]